MKLCNGKKIHTKNSAYAERRYIQKVKKKDMRVYLCPHCHGYHLTKKHTTYD